MHKTNNCAKGEITEPESLRIHLACILIHIGFLLSVAILALPFLGAYFLGSEHFFPLLIVTLICIPFTLLMFSLRGYFDMRNLYISMKFAFRNRIIQGVLITFLNLGLLLVVGFQTMIPTNYLLITALALSAGALIFSQKKEAYKQLHKFFILSSILVNLILIINFLFCFDEKIEYYKFYRNFEYVFDTHTTIARNGHYQQSTKISLEKSAYDEYYGIRIFSKLSDLERAKGVAYKFRTGVFGIRVLKGYWFY